VDNTIPLETPSSSPSAYTQFPLAFKGTRSKERCLSLFLWLLWISWMQKC